MIFLDILLYTLFAVAGAMIAEATDAKFGQHLGMGAFAAVLSHFVFGWLISMLFPDQLGILLLILNWLLYAVLLAATCFLFAFIAYQVNAQQALKIGLTIGVCHILYRLFWLWAVS